MIRRLLNREIKEEIIIIDSRFPRPIPLGFRNNEINEYFKRIPGFKSYAMYPMKPGQLAWFKHGYGVAKKEFSDNKKHYLKYYPENSKKVCYLDPKIKYKVKLAYVLFLAETYTLLPFLEKNKINFIFVLYPGGAFGLNNQSSDNMLKEIFRSKYFKKVITTKNVTYDYIIKKKLCPKSKISPMNGILQFKQEEVLDRKYYSKDKETMDICFVGHKYSKRGIDKGYDLFIDSAKKLAKECKKIRFHVVGQFNDEDIDISEIRDKIKFYGLQKPDFLLKLYTNIDIFVSPNRPYVLYEGSFDGFPIGGDAGFCGVALFVTDPLKQNIYLNNKKEFIEIKADTSDIARKVKYYYERPEELIKLSKCGQKRMQKEFNMDEQLNMRIELFRGVLAEL